jgi:hypothetical protein
VFIVGCLGNSGRSPEEILAIGQSRARYLEASDKKRQVTSGATSNGSRISSGEIVGTLQARDYKGLNHEGARDGKAIVTVAALTVSDLTKGQGSNQAVASGFLQVVDVVHES